MCKVSCDICKFSSPHDYVPNHYYCNKGLFFNDREPRSNCEQGELDDWSYKNKYGISYTMQQFKEAMSKINDLRNQEKQILENFEKSICEKGDFKDKLVYFPNWAEEVKSNIPSGFNLKTIKR